MNGGYPDGDVDQTVSYLVVAAVMMGLVLNSASINTRALEQNDDRGVMIGQLAAIVHRHPDLRPAELYVDELGVAPRFQRQAKNARVRYAST